MRTLLWQANLISSRLWISSRFMAFADIVKSPNYIFSPDLSPELTVIPSTTDSLSACGSLIGISNVRCPKLIEPSSKPVPPQPSHLNTWQSHPFSYLVPNLGTILDSAFSLMPHILPFSKSCLLHSFQTDKECPFIPPLLQPPGSKPVSSGLLQ